MQDLGRLRLNDIRELEEVLMSLLKGEERLVARGATQQFRYEGDSYRRGDARNRSEGRSEQDRSNRREQDRLREDTRRAPRVTFAEAEERDWVADLNGRGTNTQRASTRRDVWSDSEDDVSGTDDLESSCSDGSSSDDGQRQLAAANESERRSAAEGTYARADRRFRRNDQAGRGDSRERPDAERREHDNRRRSFGPCAACGGRNHSAHYCNRRCKLCKQVHDAGQCELYRHLQGFVKYARAKEDNPPTLTGLGPNGLPQLTSPPVEARSIFAFVAGSEWPDEDLENGQTTENGDYYDGIFADGGGIENDRPGPGDGFSEASIDSAVSVERLASKKAPKVVRLREGESLGWWSSQRYDQRVLMRAMVGGAVNDEQTTILLDTGANVSFISERFVKNLRLRAVPNHGRSIDVQGIGKGALTTKRRVLVKVTLEGRLVYEFEMWVLPHNAGVDVVLGMDFMIPAGVRLDLYRSTAMLPGETTLTLLKSKKMEANPVGRREVPCRSPRGLRVEAHGCADFGLQKNRPPAETHALWVRRTEKLIPTLLSNRRGDLAKVHLTNVADRDTTCDVFTDFVVWVPHGDLPREAGYVRPKLRRYKDWQVLAYKGLRDPTLLGLESEHYERWAAAQPSLVDRPAYTTPTDIHRRPSDDSGHGLTLRDGRVEEASGTSDADGPSVTVGVGATTEVAGDDSDGDGDGEDVSDTCDVWDHTEAATECFETCSSDVANGSYVNCDVSDSAETDLGDKVVDSHVTSREPSLSGDEDLRTRPKRREATAMVLSTDPDAVAELDATFVSAMRVSVAEETQGPAEGDATCEHSAADAGLEDYAHELAFLPDLTEATPTTLGYSAPNVQDDEHTSDEQSRLVAMIRSHKEIMIASGNALPLPAYEVVCDIDVQGHPPIKQRARRVPLRYLQQLYELLKGLLKAGLIAFSDSPWASPIVIVFKKNGKDIRLCINYKHVNTSNHGVCDASSGRPVDRTGALSVVLLARRCERVLGGDDDATYPQTFGLRVCPGGISNGSECRLG
ncbi:hypothetical protein PC123_g25178 [Phytophthora cactorum]|nr:hypothetical protein PC123_g25178 [Phytophthora cactorum]